MISRVADHCFWLGRYLERAESTARLLTVTRNLALDGDLAPRRCWLPAVVISGEEGPFRAAFGDAGVADGELVQRYLTWDDANLSSLRRSVAAARDNARWARDVLSHEGFEGLNELHLWLSSTGARDEYQHDRDGFFRRVRSAAQQALGAIHGTMLHDDAFDFILLGVMLERTGQTARLLDVHHHALGWAGSTEHVERTLWLTVLRACSGLEPYLRRSRGRASAGDIARFLVLDPQFPRSVRHGVSRACKRLRKLRPPGQPELPGARSLARLLALEEWLERRAPEALEPARLHGALTHIVDETAAICEEIGLELLGYPAQGETAAAGQ